MMHKRSPSGLPVAATSLYEVAIVGGGVVGCAAARALSRYALSLCVIEKAVEVGFGTSKANSGIIHGGHHAAPTSLKGRLEWEGNQRWDGLCADLGFGLRRCGELTVARVPEEVAVLERLLAQGAAKGVPWRKFGRATVCRRRNPTCRRTWWPRCMRRRPAWSTRMRRAFG